MDTNLNILFYIGILVPTVITIGVFVGFLLCWFRCDLRNKLLEFRKKKNNNRTSCGERNGMLLYINPIVEILATASETEREVLTFASTLLLV